MVMVLKHGLFQYVDDLIEGTVRMMDTPDDITGPVNIGNPDEFTILEKQLKKSFGSLVAAQRLYFNLFRPMIPNNTDDNTLAKNLLNWEPKSRT